MAHTVLDGVAVTLLALIRDVLGSNLGPDKCYVEAFHGVSQLFQTNVRTVRRRNHHICNILLSAPPFTLTSN
jgi:hypothetical protein